MNIVHMLPHFKNDGNGVVYAAVDLACAQSADGYAIACIGSGRGSLTSLLSDCSVASYVVAAPKPRWFGKLRHLSQLFHLLRELHPQVVHAHSVPTAIMAKLLQPLLGYKLVTSVHNGSRLKNILLAVGDRVVCVSDSVAEGMKRLHISQARIRIVRNGPLGSLRRPAGDAATVDIGIEKPAIVTVAALHTHKGIHDLIEAFALARKSIPELSLYILGKGPEKLPLQLQTARLGCKDSIHFEGFVRDPRPYLTRADVFVLPSHREAFGLALAEAREAGCAVVGTDTGGIPEVLEGGRAGIIVPVGDPARLGQVLVTLLSDPHLLEAWRHRAVSNLCWLHISRVSRETTAIYAELLSSSAAGLPWKEAPRLHQPVRHAEHEMRDVPPPEVNGIAASEAANGLAVRQDFG
jgi:glycosyltransferase involved in cell wall biosynthesis